MSRSIDASRIGWVGLGKMGLPMARRLAEAGHKVTVLARHDDGAARAAAAGFATVRTMAALAGAADVVVMTIPDDDALARTVLAPGGLAEALGSGHVLVECSTVSPSISRSVADALAAGATGYLRAPVSGSTATAAAGQLTVLASGPRAAFDAVLPVLTAFSTRQYYLGPGDEARVMKLALNGMVAATSALVAEAIDYGRENGLDTGSMMEVIANSAVASPLVAYKRQKVVDGDWTPAFSVDQMIKDLSLLLASGDRSRLPVAAMVRGMLAAASGTGQGDADFFVLVRDYGSVVPAGPGWRAGPPDG